MNWTATWVGAWAAILATIAIAWVGWRLVTHVVARILAFRFTVPSHPTIRHFTGPGGYWLREGLFNHFSFRRLLIMIGVAAVIWGLSGFFTTGRGRGRLPQESRISLTIGAAIVAGVMYRERREH